MKYAVINSKRLILPSGHSKARCENGDNTRLASSIARFGVLSPIYVRELVGGGRFEIVSGKRRFCASRLAGLERLPCFILEKGENPTLTSLTLDIFSDFDPFELADRLKNELLKSEGSAETLAKKLGLDISDFLKLLTPTCMSELERRIARENSLSKAEIQKISSLPSREARLSALISSKRSYNLPRVHTKDLSKKVSARRRVALGGLGFFENTLKRSVEILKSAGIDAEREVEEKNGEVNYTVRVKR